MQMALEYMEWLAGLGPDGNPTHSGDQVKEALRAALAEPVEPVALRPMGEWNGGDAIFWEKDYGEWKRCSISQSSHWTPLPDVKEAGRD
jgi:hypothetical protein